MEGPPPEQNYLDQHTVLAHLQLAPGQWVGDFGVGSAAHFAIAAAEKVGGAGGVVMFDVVKAALSGAMTSAQARGLANCRGVWTNLEIYGGATGVKDGSLDAGILMNILHQSTKPKDILAEVQRMLKVGAKIVIVDWQPDAEVSIAPAKTKRLAPEYVTTLAKSIGFAPVEQFSAGPYHWGLVVAKT